MTIPLIKYKMYEYQIELFTTLTLDEIRQKLNNLSKEGWELICVVEDRHYFKRKITKNL